MLQINLINLSLNQLTVMTHPYLKLNNSFSHSSRNNNKKKKNLKIILHRLKNIYILSTLIKYDLCKHVVGHFRNCQLSDNGGSVLSTVFADKMQRVFKKRSERIMQSYRLFQKSAQLVRLGSPYSSLDQKNKNTMLL